MHSKDADKMSNSVDRDQTVTLEAVWSGSSQLSKNLGTLRYLFVYVTG